MIETEAADKPSSRFRGLDILRGAIMVLMAIDHVRVFAGVPAGGPNPAVFFTRWITHFCAPGFVFLAGTSAYLLGQKIGRPALVRFLLIRGLFLVLLELTYLRTAWTFNVDVHEYNLAGVIWMIGWCMVALAGLSALSPLALAAFGAVIVAGHNLVPLLIGVTNDGARPSFGPLARLLYFGGDFRLGDEGPRFVVLYSLIPWVGVIALGYAFGTVMTRPQEERDRITRRIGLIAVAAFIALRAARVYGNPQPWDGESLITFLNPAKYPASLLFLLMTLGPMLALLPSLIACRAASRPGFKCSAAFRSSTTCSIFPSSMFWPWE